MAKRRNKVTLHLKKHGIVWWILIGWWWRPIMWFCLGLLGYRRA